MSREIVHTLTEHDFDFITGDTALLDGTGTDTIVLPQLPVFGAGTVVVNSGTLEADDYVATETGHLIRTDGTATWSTGHRRRAPPPTGPTGGKTSRSPTTTATGPFPPTSGWWRWRSPTGWSSRAPPPARPSAPSPRNTRSPRPTSPRANAPYRGNIGCHNEHDEGAARQVSIQGRSTGGSRSTARLAATSALSAGSTALVAVGDDGRSGQESPLREHRTLRVPSPGPTASQRLGKSRAPGPWAYARRQHSNLSLVVEHDPAMHEPEAQSVAPLRRSGYRGVRAVAIV